MWVTADSSYESLHFSLPLSAAYSSSFPGIDNPRLQYHMEYCLMQCSEGCAAWNLSFRIYWFLVPSIAVRLPRCVFQAVVIIPLHTCVCIISQRQVTSSLVNQLPSAFSKWHCCTLTLHDPCRMLSVRLVVFSMWLSWAVWHLIGNYFSVIDSHIAADDHWGCFLFCAWVNTILWRNPWLLSVSESEELRSLQLAQILDPCMITIDRHASMPSALISYLLRLSIAYGEPHYKSNRTASILKPNHETNGHS